MYLHDLVLNSAPKLLTFYDWWRSTSQARAFIIGIYVNINVYGTEVMNRKCHSNCENVAENLLVEGIELPVAQSIF